MSGPFSKLTKVTAVTNWNRARASYVTLKNINFIQGALEYYGQSVMICHLVFKKYRTSYVIPYITIYKQSYTLCNPYIMTYNIFKRRKECHLASHEFNSFL